MIWDIGVRVAESIYWLRHSRFRFSKAKRMFFSGFFTARVRYGLLLTQLAVTV
jgi:hypothetical protein